MWLIAAVMFAFLTYRLLRRNRQNRRTLARVAWATVAAAISLMNFSYGFDAGALAYIVTTLLLLAGLLALAVAGVMALIGSVLRRLNGQPSRSQRPDLIA